MKQDDQHIIEDQERREQLLARAIYDNANIDLIREMFEEVVTDQQIDELIEIQVDKELEI